MFLGTGSDVGKSIAATAFCRIFKRRGFGVAPFKAQNMSNNSYVTIEGGEIGRAQAVQAEAAGLQPSVHMNPVLIKPSSELGAQIVVHGKVFKNMDAASYHEFKHDLAGAIMDSYERLAREHEAVIMEGAGSCCEMNLKENDLVNFSMAKAAKARCILVADIDRGGVFAQIIGTYDLMDQQERDMTIGFLINKFRGDPKLFASGIDYIEKKTGKPVLGLVPFYNDILIDSEDSVAVQENRRRLRPTGPDFVNIAVVKLPSISNFTDFEILERERDVVVNYLSRPKDLTDDYDCIILPGAKNVMEDAAWMKRMGWMAAVRRFAKDGGRVFGICGGFQLLGQKIEDPLGVESGERNNSIMGAGLLPVNTVLLGEKTVQKVSGTCLVNKKRIRGYEIHMGRSTVKSGSCGPFSRLCKSGGRDEWHDGCVSENSRVAGTYVHGVFDSPGFRKEYLDGVRIEKGLSPRRAASGRLARFRHYERLADHFERYCTVDRIIDTLRLL
ncbi:MAG: cobyric acid synthase CobQ [Deltaproteobacteria bacterium]|nr:MAG: cobyric acid synthase CobQ [Deltaproteobacteria bacterium]